MIVQSGKKDTLQKKKKKKLGDNKTPDISFTSGIEGLVYRHVILQVRD